MASISFKRGMSTNLDKEPLSDGQLYFTVDEGKIYLDYQDEGDLKRKAFYSGVLTIGDYSFDGTENVDIPVYDGETE